MFFGDQHGDAEEAIRLYVSRFDCSQVLDVERYGTDEDEPEGTVKLASFSVAGDEYLAMDSGRDHPFTFNPTISVFVDSDGEQA
jgi:predicted 3-demethylubiquinone-9 3-methyltransferase (glyoxalase superfamily)